MLLKRSVVAETGCYGADRPSPPTAILPLLFARHFAWVGVRDLRSVPVPRAAVRFVTKHHSWVRRFPERNELAVELIGGRIREVEGGVSKSGRL